MKTIAIFTKTRMGYWLSLMLTALLLGTGTAQAVQFQEGDVFAAIGSGQVQHYDSTGVLLETLNTTRGGFTTGMAFDSAGNLYVTNFSDSSVSRFDDQGNLLEAQFIQTDVNSSVESIVFAANGDFYVGQADGTRDILKYDSAGTLLQRFDVATTTRGSDWIDLAADQTTLLYTSENFEVMAYDTATDTQLADFALLDNRPAFALRILDDGGVLVSDSINVKRLDSAGNTIQTYDVVNNNNFFSLNLDSDGTSFWAGDFGTGDLFKFDMASGAVLQTISTGSGSLFGVTVFGEITAAIPTPEPGVLALLSLGIVGMTLTRRRRKNVQ